MKLNHISIVCIASVSLLSCSTTGDPSAGGYWGWSAEKAMKRVAESDERLATLDRTNYDLAVNASVLVGAAEAECMRLLRSGHLKLYGENDLHYTTVMGDRQSRALSKLTSIVLAHLAAKFGDHVGDKLLRECTSQGVIVGFFKLVGGIGAKTFAYISAEIRDAQIEEALRIYFVWLEDFEIRAIRRAIVAVADGNLSPASYAQDSLEEELLNTLEHENAELARNAKVAKFFVGIAEKIGDSKRS